MIRAVLVEIAITNTHNTSISLLDNPNHRVELHCPIGCRRVMNSALPFNTPTSPFISEGDGREESLRDADELHEMEEPPPVPVYDPRGRYGHCKSMLCISVDPVSLLPPLLLLLLDHIAIYYVTLIAKFCPTLRLSQNQFAGGFNIPSEQVTVNYHNHGIDKQHQASSGAIVTCSVDVSEPFYPLALLLLCPRERSFILDDQSGSISPLKYHVKTKISLPPYTPGGISPFQWC